MQELAVSTSSYGSAIPRHFGRMRAPGQIVWATDLAEHKTTQGNGKGKPSTTTYSYTASFAVALSSRPILGIGRIWADGNLLRGEDGVLKTAGTLRVHTGSGDQAADPLIIAAEGAARCPAFRGLAYAVFEDLELADFGNRIPALSFEVFADYGTLVLAEVLAGVIEDCDAPLELTGLAGLSCEGPVGETLAMLDPVFPMDCDAGERLTIARESALPLIALPPPVVALGDGDFGGPAGFVRRRGAEAERPVEVLRYYDTGRDYQPGTQRAPGRPLPGQPQAIELPAALDAAAARALIEGAARRGNWARQVLSWRTAQLDPAVVPGAVVTVPGEAGRWRVRAWEWRASGVELSLTRLPPALVGDASAADPGRFNPPPDLALAETVLAAFELPRDGTGDGTTPLLQAAVSSPGAGWTGAALYIDPGDGGLQPLGPSGRARSIMGVATTVLPAAGPALFDRSSSVTVTLVDPAMALASTSLAQLANGANRALLGGELMQFADAESLGGGQWRLTGLLRGRGGSEAALASHVAGEAFVLLDGTPVALDAALVGTWPEGRIAAVGLADPAPVLAPIVNRGATLRPLSPVHGRRLPTGDGSLQLVWTRRARGAWTWLDDVEVPLHEASEAYRVEYAVGTAVLASWELTAPELAVPSATWAALAVPGGTFAIRQSGAYSLSDPLIVPVSN